MYYLIWNIEICWIIFSKMLTAFKIYENMHLVRIWIRNRKEETHASLYLYIVWTSVAGGFVCFDACCSLAAFWRIYLLWCMLLTCSVSCWFFFEITQYNSDTHNARILTPLWTQIRKPYPYDHLRRLSRQILEIDEVTIGVSLSTRTSPTTKCTTPLNPRIVVPMRSRTQDLRCYWDSFVTARVRSIVQYLPCWVD